MSDKDYMKIAIDLASNNAGSVSGGPFGAIIVKDGVIIAQASNSVTVDNDPTAHAEVNAIRKACKALKTFNLEGCTIYTSCEPCPMCLSAIYWAHIDKVFYAADKNDAAKAGFDDDFIYKELSLPISKRRVTFSRISETEGLKPFVIWQENNEKIDY